MGTYIKNIWTNPKSSITALIGLGAAIAEISQAYPTIKWLALTATIIGAITKLLMTDQKPAESK